MPLDPAQRISIIQEIAGALGQRTWAEVDLILEQFGFTTGNHWDWEDAALSDYVRAMVKGQSDDHLAALHQYALEQSAALTTGPWQAGRLRLFMIHLAAHREFVGEIRRRLGTYGVDAFVAHDSIDPSDEWIPVIEAALRTCHAAVAFVHAGFRESPWTDQEIGFCLARRVPILPLAIDALPHGFLARFQAAKCRGLDEERIAKLTLDWLVATTATQTHMAEGLVYAMTESMSFNQTRALWPYLNKVPSLTPEQMQRLEQAAQSNVDVSEASIDWVPAPARIRELIQRHSGYDDEVPF